MENAANDYTARIPQDPATTPVRFAANGSWVTFQLRGAGSAAPQVRGPQVPFSDVTATADELTYEATSTGLKESIVLEEPPAAAAAPLRYVFDLRVSAGVTPRLTAAGEVQFHDETGAVVFSIPAGTMLDSAEPEPVTSTQVAYELAETGQGWTMTVVPDMGWLRDPARVYPVLVDPTLNAGVSTDCWIGKETPDTSFCGASSVHLKAGRTPAGEKRRTLVDFDVSSIPVSATITDANLKLYLDAEASPGSGQANYDVHAPSRKITNRSTWNHSDSTNPDTTWAGGSPSGVVYATKPMGGSGSGYKTWDVASLVTQWLVDDPARRGILLKQTANETVEKVLFFASSTTDIPDPEDPSRKATPRLVVHYTDAPDPAVAEAGDRDFWTYVTKELTDRITAQVNVGNGNLLVTAQDLRVAGVAGWDLVLARYYNSAAAGFTDPSNLGQGWSSSLGGSVRLTFPNPVNDNGSTDDDRVFFFGPSGYRVHFEANEGGGYNRRGGGINADLTHDATTGDYTLTWLDESEYVFDGTGRLDRMVDKNGNTLSFTYDAAGNLDQVTDTRGRALQLQYNADGMLAAAELRTPGGAPMLRWAYDYDGVPARLVSSQLTLAEAPVIGGTVIDTVVAGGGNIGAVTGYDYDATGRLSVIRDARENADTTALNGGTTRIGYTSDGRVATLTREVDHPNPAARFTDTDPTTTFTYLDTADPAPGSTCTDADATHGAATRTIVDAERTGDEATDTTSYCIDGQDRVLRTTDAQGVQRAKAYTPNSNVVTADLAGLADGLAQYQFTYDNDNPTHLQTPDGAQYRAAYDDTNHPHLPTATRGDDTHAASDAWTYRYDNAGNIITAASATGPDVEYRYCWNTLGQLTRIDPVTATGTPANSTDPAVDGSSCNADTAQGNDTLLTYNTNDELAAIDRPTGGDETYTYDNLSRLATVTDARGITTSFGYDGLDRVVRQTFTQPGQPDRVVRFTYDLAGNRIQVNDPNGWNVYGFDELNRLTTESVQNPTPNLTYRYDEAGNLREVRESSTAVTTYGYDNLNRVTTASDQRTGTGAITFGYDNHDKRTRTVYPVAGGNDVIQEARHTNGGKTRCVYSYRANNPPSNDADSCPAADTIGLLTFHSYDYNNGAGETDTKYQMTELGGRTTRYTYDPIKRLTGATVRPDDTQTSSPLRSFSYGYDRHSNLTRDVTTGTTPGLDTGTLWMAHDDGDELCATLEQPTDPGLTCASTGLTGLTRYTHDPAGNLQTATGAGALAGLTLSYNPLGQTSSIDPAGPTGPITMAYDGVMQDRRISAGNTNMAYGFSGLTAQATTGTGAHSEAFVRDPAGNLLAMTDPTTGDTRYYLTDDQKTVLATINADTGQLIRYLYEPYGQQIRTWIDPNPGTSTNDGAENPALNAPAVDHNPWRYASGYLDTTTGLLKFGTRYYIPQLSRWTQPDPADGKPESPLTLNPYQYANCNPANLTDPSGRGAIGCALATIAVAGIFASDVLGIYAFALSPTPQGAVILAASTVASLVGSALVVPVYESECL